MFAAAKGSPGVTTTVAALAGSWPAHREALVVEADGSGGDLVVRLCPASEDAPGVHSEPTTVHLAAAARGGLSDRVLLEHLQRLPGSGEIRALVAPPSPFSAATALNSLVDAGLAECLSSLGSRDVLVDVGRLDPGSAELELVRTVGQVVLVVRPCVSSVIHTRELAAGLHDLEVEVSLMVLGEKPYPPAEVAAAIGVPSLVGVMADDPIGAAGFEGNSGRPRAWARSRLVRSAAMIADRLAPPPPPPPPATDGEEMVSRSAGNLSDESPSGVTAATSTGGER
jgi:hypothetical protein